MKTEDIEKLAKKAAEDLNHIYSHPTLKKAYEEGFIKGAEAIKFRRALVHGIEQSGEDKLWFWFVDKGDQCYSSINIHKLGDVSTSSETGLKSGAELLEDGSIKLWYDSDGVQGHHIFKPIKILGQFWPTVNRVVEEQDSQSLSTTPVFIGKDGLKRGVENLSNGSKAFWFVVDGKQLSTIYEGKWDVFSSKTPHRCPVCAGIGSVPKGFYNVHNYVQDLGLSAMQKCLSCHGSGIVWG